MGRGIINFFFSPILALSAYSLFYVKDMVLKANYSLSEIKNQIDWEKEKISLIKAETTYLTSGTKLSEAASKLGLRPSGSSQIIEDPLGPEKISEGKKELVLERRRPKWRYKKLADKYLTVTSGRKK